MSGLLQRMRDALGVAFGPKPSPKALGVLAADMHAHWLPGLDDGAKDLEQSMVMLRGFAERGYTTLWATPHSMGDHYKNGPAEILPALERVREAASAEGLPLDLHAAAEYYLDDHFLQLLDGKADEALLLLPDKWLLFELSYLNRPSQLQDALFRIITAGYKPLLAHPERYPYFHDSGSLRAYRELAEQDVALQVNLGSLAGSHGRSAQRVARAMVDADLVRFLGTDLHRPGQWANLDALKQDRWFHRVLNSGRLLNAQWANTPPQP